MPLTDLVRYFNAADRAGDSMLYLEDGCAAAWHHDLRLRSLFQPIVDLRAGAIVGHQASLLAEREDGTAVGIAEAYAACASAEAVVHFDRLCRTLHALNFLRQQTHAGGYLQLAVHPRHVLAVPGQHGLVYEAILRRCGLAPEDIVLEIDPGRLAPSCSQLPQLASALASYRQRGYRLAITGPAADELTATLAWQPAIVTLAAAAPDGICHQARAAGLLIQFTGIADETALATARNAGDLATGPLFGRPQALCHATHERRGVAYNAPSLTGASR